MNFPPLPTFAMRKYFLLFALLLFSFAPFVFGQSGSEPTNSQAKVYYKAYNAAITKLKAMGPSTSKAMYQQQLTTAETNIKNIKKAEPGYNAGALESELSGYQATYTQNYVGKEMDADLSKLKSQITAYRNGTATSGSSQTYFADDLQRELKAFKAKYPTYDAGGLDKEVNEAIEFVGAKKGSEKQASMDAHDVLNDAEDLFLKGYEANFTMGNGDINAERPALKKPTEEFKSKAASVVGADFQSKIQGQEAKLAQELLPTMRDMAAKDIRDAAEIKTFLQTSAHDNSAYSRFYKLQFMSAYWGIAAKAFPSESSFSGARSSADNALAAVGGEENISGLISKNHAAHIKTVKVDKAVVSDPALEADFKAVFNTLGLKETVQMVTITSADWGIYHDNISGKVIGRARQGCVISKTASGKCMKYRFSIKQDLVGSGYGPSKYYDHRGEEIACENAQ
jgi:hypothetical protein